LVYSLRPGERDMMIVVVVVVVVFVVHLMIRKRQMKIPPFLPQ
jgi:hypothetical protein